MIKQGKMPLIFKDVVPADINAAGQLVCKHWD
jgi:hypothetical protein